MRQHGIYLTCNQRNSVDITIFDDLGIGGQASGIAAGLLHPYSGLHAKLNRFGMEGLKSTQELLESAKTALGADVLASSGMLRFSFNKVSRRGLFKLRCYK